MLNNSRKSQLYFHHAPLWQNNIDDRILAAIAANGASLDIYSLMDSWKELEKEQRSSSGFWMTTKFHLRGIYLDMVKIANMISPLGVDVSERLRDFLIGDKRVMTRLQPHFIYIQPGPHKQCRSRSSRHEPEGDCAKRAGDSG